MIQWCLKTGTGWSFFLEMGIYSNSGKSNTLLFSWMFTWGLLLPIGFLVVKCEWSAKKCFNSSMEAPNHFPIARMGIPMGLDILDISS